MSRGRLILITLALIVIAIMGFVYFYTSYHYEEKVIWRGLQGDAKKDPYHLTEKFLQKKGYDITRQKNYARLDSDDLNNIDTLFFTNDARTLSETQATDIVNWVEDGGHVVVFAGRSTHETDKNARPTLDALLDETSKKRNPLFQQSGIVVVECSGDECLCPDSGSCSTDAADELDSAPKEFAEIEAILGITEDDNKTIEQKIDDLLTPDKSSYSTTFSLNGKPITIKMDSADWLYARKGGKAKQRYAQVARCYGDIFSVFTVGSGTITLYNSYPRDFGHFNFSDSIWDNDNASFLDGLLQIGGGKRILWFENTLYPSIWTFIWQYGLFALTVGMLLLLAWIWKNSRRFGSVIIEDERKGLTLERHLRATGQFYYQNEQTNMLLQNCYEQLDKKIAHRIANHKRLKRPELAEKIAEITEFSQAKIQRVLERRFPQSDGEFTQLIHYINEIQKRL